MGPQGRGWQFYLADHLTLLYTKYIGYGHHGFREGFRVGQSLPNYTSTEAIDSPGMVSLGHRGLISRIYVGGIRH